MRMLNYYSGDHYVYFSFSVAIFIFHGLVSGSYLALAINLRPRSAMSIFKPALFFHQSWYKVILRPVVNISKRIILILFGVVLRRSEAFYFAIRRNKASDEENREEYAKFNRKLKEADFECRIMDLIGCICKQIPEMVLSLHFIFQNMDTADLRNEVIDDPFLLLALFKLATVMFVEVGFEVGRYIMLPAWQVAMILKDALQIVYSLSSHHMNVFCSELSLDRAKNKLLGGIIYFLWRMVEVASRVQILIVLVLINKYSLLSILPHFLIFALLVRFISFRSYYRTVTRLEHYLLQFRFVVSVAISFIVLFIPFMLPSRRDYLVYYSTIFVENTALMLTAFFLQFISWSTMLTLYATYFAALALMVSC